MRTSGWKSLFLAVGLAIPLGACSSGEPTVSESLLETPPARASDLVVVDPSALESGRITTAKVESAVLPQKLGVPGRLDLNENRTVRVGSIVEGRIVRLAASVGDEVGRGSLLASLHSPEVHEIRAGFAQAVAQFETRRADLEYARSVQRRAANLLELKAGSLQEKQRADADLQRAEMDLKVARAEIGRFEERLKTLGLSSDGAVEEYGGESEDDHEEDELIPVLSPIRGTVLERPATPGLVVSPAQDLFIISDLNTLWAYAEVPEQRLSSLRKGAPVSMEVQAYPGQVFPGRVSHIADVLNPETRTVSVLCEVNNSDRQLKAEMYVTVEFETGLGKAAPVVPASAVQSVEGRDLVFVDEGGGRFRARPVRIGRSAEEVVEILQGLSAGESVAVEGGFLLKSELLKHQIEG